MLTEFEERILILAPLGRDARCVEMVLAKEGLRGDICDSIDTVCSKLREGAGALLITEEAISGNRSQTLKCCLQAQETWSDLPIVILTSSGETTQAELDTLKMFGPIGNVTLLERPLRGITLNTTIQVALRNRRRQYGVRELLRQITHARDTEQSARHEAERLNRIKDDFLSTLSHELRTPLTPLMGWTRMLMSGKLDKANQQKALETIYRNVQAQTQLIEDLLDISRIITGKMRLNIISINVKTVLDSALDVIRPAAAAKGIKLEVSMPISSVRMKADQDRLQQVFWNLLTNAVKFTPQGGTIITTLRVMDGVHTGDENVEVEVADTGVGIEQAFLPVMFERFTQADNAITRSFGGLGIGLSIVQSLVELHGGTITAESPGKDLGSKFTVRFPVIAQTASDSGITKVCPQPAHPPAELDQIKVLLVDDETETREVLAIALMQYGAEVATACSAREALQKFEERRPDILISDLGMPGEDGYELIRQVRLGGEKTPAIALTAYAREEDSKRCLTSGFQRHVTKPVDPARLVSAISEMVSNGHLNG